MHITLLGKMFLNRLFFAINYLFFRKSDFKDIFMHDKSLLGSAMKKLGFSLIELMVVVVILSVLSAVAVPKLFGAIAKSKASELSPAAKTYVKQQNTYIGERHMLGPWSAIGYVSPGMKVSADSSITTNFSYGSGDIKGNGGDASVAIEANSVTVGWVATSRVALDDVPKNSSWTVSIVVDNAGLFRYTATIPTDGEALTPTFTQLGH